MDLLDGWLDTLSKYEYFDLYFDSVKNSCVHGVKFNEVC